jgi:hypothetical protein
MAKAEAAKSDTTRLNAATRSVFLAALSETANVSASAKAAGIRGSAVYAERRRLCIRRGRWRRGWRRRTLFIFALCTRWMTITALAER